MNLAAELVSTGVTWPDVALALVTMGGVALIIFVIAKWL